MKKNIIFNGISKPYLFFLKGSERPAWAPVKNQILEIPGRQGGYISNATHEIRKLNLAVGVKAPNGMTMEQLKEDMADWLITDDICELIITDEPDRVYYAKVDGTFDPETLVDLGNGVITFICPDPYKYGKQKSHVFLSGIERIINEGTADTYPIFIANVKSQITNLDIVTNDAYMRIGEPNEVDQVQFEKEQLIMNDTMQTLTGWASGIEIEGGSVSGAMYTDGETFRAKNYGTGTYWHGPAVKKSLSEELQDFQIDMYASLKTDSVIEAGRVEIYLLDVNNKIIGKLALKDLLTGSDAVWGEARIGNVSQGHYLIRTQGIRPGVWNQFYGLLRLRRVGKENYAYISMIDTKTGRHHTRWEEIYIDTEEKYLDKLAQIQVHIGQYETKEWIHDIGVHEIRVYKINQPSDNQIPYIAHEGDTIEIDHAKNDIRVNGEIRLDLKDFGASFFSLKNGENIISCDPFDAVDLTVKWREKFK